jgi:prevent-host-death family protein
MSTVVAFETLENLPHTPASDVKKRGWRGIMETVRRTGAVAVTNHDRPEAVILPIDEYGRLLKFAQDADAGNRAKLEALRRKYDEKLAVLNAPDAGEKLDSIFDKPIDLGGRVIAGASF